MVRLLAVRASIAALKRAIRLSDKLSPAAWQFLAICSAALFLFSVLAYRDSQQQIAHGAGTLASQAAEEEMVAFKWKVRIPEAIERDVEATRGVIINQKWGLEESGRTGFSMQDSSYIGGLDYANAHTIPGWAWDNNRPGPKVWIFDLERVSSSFGNPSILAHEVGHSLGSMRLVSTTIAPHYSAELLPDLPPLWRLFSQAPTFYFQAAPEEGSSPLKWVMSWAPIFGMIVSPLVGIGSLVLAWIGLHRKRAEEALLYLQIQKCQFEIEKLKRELEASRLEEAKSPIILS